MLPKLQDTDLLAHPPDASGLDIWAPGFRKASLPEGIGVYCFYDPISGAPIYIGSACGSPQPWAGTGLWLRIQTYVHPRKNRREKTERVGLAVKERGLLLKVWLTQTEGDAHKYETDAIVKHRPELNVKNAGHMSFEAKQERVRAGLRAAGERRKQRIVYEPDAERLCLGPCGLTKKCREFSRHPRRKFGVDSICKLCKAAAVRKGPRPHNYAPTPIGKTCRRCGGSGPFHRDRSRKDGLSLYCVTWAAPLNYPDQGTFGDY
jgi:hypothetical protein